MSSVIAFREILTVISEDRSVAQRETACPTSHSELIRWFKEKSPFRLGSGFSEGSGDLFTASTWGVNVSKKDVFLAFLSSLLGPYTRPKGMRGTPYCSISRREGNYLGSRWLLETHGHTLLKTYQYWSHHQSVCPRWNQIETTAASGKTSGPQKSNLQRKRAGETVSAAILLTGTAHGKYRGTSSKQPLVFEEVGKFASILTSKASRCLFPTWESDGTKAVYIVTYSSAGLCCGVHWAALWYCTLLNKSILIVMLRNLHSFYSLMFPTRL